MPPKTTSPYIAVKESAIHNKGVYAEIFIPAGTRVIEYVGEKITKSEAERRAQVPLSRHKLDRYRHGAVYIFELNSRYDLDGDVSYNTARFINHSCEPNCETENESGRIWITALRDILPGEELSYNYGYGFEDYEEHVCHCGSARCVGFILDEQFWGQLKRVLSSRKRQRLPRPSPDCLPIPFPPA